MHIFTRRLPIFLVLFVGLLIPAFAAGNKEVPQVQVQSSGPQYFNPQSSGTNNTATLTFSVKLYVKSNKGYIPQYTVTIEDQSGNVVRDISETQKSDIGWFMSLFTGYKEFTISKTITWDGKDKNGQIAPDGKYTAKLSVVDDSGNKQSTTLGDMTIITKPPVVTINAPNGLIFNPTVPGKLSTFQIDQTNGTPEPLWTGAFKNQDGTAVRTFTWKDSAPQSFSWDGKDDNGASVPDGTYSYHVQSTDPAGNASQDYTIDGIVLNTEKTPVTVSLSEPYISPNGDGIKDVTVATLSTTSKIGIASWDLSLSNSAGTVVRDVNGQGPFPTTLTFDGKDASGNVLPSGAYTANFKASFVNDAEGDATAALVINTVPPQAGIALSTSLFSPTPTSLKPTTTATLSASAANGVPFDTWDVAVYNSAGNVVREVKDSGAPPGAITYDGKDGSGNVIPDGSYTAKLLVTTRDGLSASASAPFTIDTVPPQVTVSVSAPVFMPNSSDASNTEIITINSSAPVTWTGTLTDSTGQTLLSTTTPLSVTKVTLDKSNPAVAQAPDGTYTLNLAFTDAAGNQFKVAPVSISLLAHPISIAISVPKGFSPNAASGPTSLVATITSSSGTAPSKWDIAVVDANGKTVADYPGTGAPPAQFQWNGAVGQQGGQNVFAPDGTYTLRLTATYASGQSGSAVSNPFVLDQTPPQLAITVTPSALIEKGGGLDGTASVSVQASDNSGTITNWSAEIDDPSGNVVTTFAGQGNPTQSGTIQGALPVPGSAPTTIARLTYAFKGTVTDPYGNQAVTTVNVPVDVIAVQRADGRIQLLVPNVLFGPYKFALDSKSAEQAIANAAILKQVAALLAAHPEYNVELDGYSMEIYKPSDRSYNREENIIVPLSKDRADTVRDALVKLGVDPSRVIARFWGGMNPLVDPLNEDLRWQNRRVEFILLPPGTPPANEPPELLKRIK